MMKTMILQLDQSPYKNGKKSGAYFKKTMDEKALQKALRKEEQLEWNSQYESLLQRLKKEYPVYYAEILGKAESLQVDFKEYFMLLCPELRQIKNEQCTTVVCKKENGHCLICHNEDDQYIEGNFCLAKIKTGEGRWFVTNDMVNMPFGNGVSWNSDGIVKTINYTHEEKVNDKELPRYFLQRHLSEASSIQDLIQRCEEMKRASGFHVNAIDVNKQEAVSIEVYKEGIDVEKIDDFYVHSNHYMHKEYAQGVKTDEGSNSLFRLHQADTMMKKADKEKENVKKILDYRGVDNEHSIFQDENAQQRTIFNFMYDTEQGTIEFDIYIFNEKRILDYFKLDQKE